ncbi:MAG: carboxyl transferase domain-containing protein [Rhodopila sp.]
MADDTVTQPLAEPARHETAAASSVGWEPELAELRKRQALARELGGKDRVARQHAGGRLTVRERIDRMLDPGSFREIGSIAGKASYDARGNITDLCRKSLRRSFGCRSYG